MRIKFLANARGRLTPMEWQTYHKAGELKDLPPDQAHHWIVRGVAVEVEDKPEPPPPPPPKKEPVAEKSAAEPKSATIKKPREKRPAPK